MYVRNSLYVYEIMSFVTEINNYFPPGLLHLVPVEAGVQGPLGFEAWCMKLLLCFELPPVPI